MIQWNKFTKKKHKYEEEIEGEDEEASYKSRREVHKCLQRHLANKYKMNHPSRSDYQKTNMQELRLEEESIHQNKCT